MLYSKYEDILFFLSFFLVYPNKTSTFAPKLITGVIAQLVEQRTENPCVPGSIPGGTTRKPLTLVGGFFVFGLFVSLTSLKILSLGKMQASLLLPSLIRIFEIARRYLFGHKRFRRKSHERWQRISNPQSDLNRYVCHAYA